MSLMHPKLWESQRDERQMKSDSQKCLPRSIAAKEGVAAREQRASRARSSEQEGLLGSIVGASPVRTNVFNSHPSILCQGSNKPQMGKMNFCSKRKDSASGGCCYHRGSDILVSCYWLILSSTCSMPLQQPPEAGFYLQSKGNHNTDMNTQPRFTTYLRKAQTVKVRHPNSTSG